MNYLEIDEIVFLKNHNTWGKIIGYHFKPLKQFMDINDDTDIYGYDIYSNGGIIYNSIIREHLLSEMEYKFEKLL